LVFYGEPRTKLHAHDAGIAMRVALYPLAFGALTSWLLAGPFEHLLSSTLPFHFSDAAASSSTWEILKEVLTTPATLLALAIIALGLAAWWWRDRLTGISKAFQGFGRFAADSFGFEKINKGIVNATQASGEALRVTQTGQLNWNVAVIMIGLIAVLVILLLGAGL
jgi:NADH-quinone oxidoreductase subunit L